MTLLASIHDVAPPNLQAVKALRTRLADLGVDPVTLLVVPNFHGRQPLEQAGETVRWLRQRADAGDEICLHGETHLQQGAIAGAWDRCRAALFTAGEGECLSLDEASARRMLVDGRRRLEDLIGVRVRGFVAPAWLEPRGFAVALAAAGFEWHEGTMFVERLTLGAGGRRCGISRQRTRTPVIGFATRTCLRRAGALAWAAVLGPVQAATGPRHPVRLALHPADAASPAVMRAAARAARLLLRAHAPATYAGALGVEVSRAAA